VIHCPCQFQYDLKGFQHAATAHLTAGLFASSRAKHMHAIVFELIDIALGGRIVPHFHIHGRGNRHGAIAGQYKVIKQIVSEPVCVFRH
jgi:hypothetical protein